MSWLFKFFQSVYRFFVWLTRSVPPKPSNPSVTFLQEEIVSHIKKAVVGLPALRPDEQKYSDEVSQIVSRMIRYVIQDQLPTVVSVPVGQGTYEITGVPANSVLGIAIANVNADGHNGEFNSAVFNVPPPDIPIPVPDAVTVEFQSLDDDAPADNS